MYFWYLNIKDTTLLSKYGNFKPTSTKNVVEEKLEYRINNIYDKCKSILRKKILDKNKTINDKLDKKFYIDYKYNKQFYDLENKDCHFIEGDVNIINFKTEFRLNIHNLVNNYMKYISDRYNYINNITDINDKYSLVGNWNTGTTPKKFNDIEKFKGIVKDIKGTTLKNISKYISEINTDSCNSNNKLQNKLEKELEDYFKDINTIISKNTIDEDLKKIYSIYYDDTDEELNSLSIEELNFYYEYFLNEKILYDNPENREYYITKYFIMIPLIKLEINEINESDIYTEEYKKKMLLLNEKNRLIFSNIESNIDVYYRQIKERCVDRDNEGQFINRSLYGMRQDLIEIAKNNNREGLFQKIPIFNSPCLEYYCNSQSYDCFEYPKTQNTQGLETKIFDTISNVLNTKDDGTIQKDNRAIINNLNIVIFGLLNISRDTNDPPKMPYIDLTILKNIRDKLNINQKFEKNDSVITEKIVEIKAEKIVEIKAEKNKIRAIMQNYILSISVTLIKKIEEHSTEIDNGNISDIHIKLNNFIQTLEEINSTTLLGTLDFLNYMKNSLQADNTCDINKLENDKFNLAKNGDLLDYKNIITNEQLKDIIDQHERQLKVSKGGGSSYKQSLIKEYKQLLKKLNQS
jgi:hypothetical protein